MTDVEFYELLNSEEDHIQINAQNFTTMLYINSEISKKITFERCKFNSIDIAENSIFKEGIVFSNCTFDRGITCRGKFNGERTLFEGCNINGKADFNKSEFNNKVSFNRTTFFSISNFKNVVFSGNTSFNKCHFEGTSNFSDNTLFKSQTAFNEAVFERNAYFQGVNFEDRVRFDNTLFCQLADFYYSNFHSVMVFHKTSFNDNVVFSYAKFTQNTCFPYTSCEGVFILRHSNFESGLDLSLSLIKGEINTFGIQLDYFDTEYISPSDAKEYNDYIEKGVITKENRTETFNVIKSHLISQNNSIRSLDFKSLEMKSYKDEVYANGSISRSDKITLWLGETSNNFGLNWWKGLCFTVIVGLFFYTISLFGITNFKYAWGWGATSEAMSDFVKYYCQFLIPTHKSTYIEYAETNWLFSISDFLGRIGVGYGIYQTISAFRKFGKK